MTAHSIKRARERANLTNEAAAGFINRAKCSGKTKEKMPSAERQFMGNKENNTQLMYYAGFLFVFAVDGACITMYHAPAWFLKKYNFSGKMRIKNPKKYLRMNCGCTYDVCEDQAWKA